MLVEETGVNHATTGTGGTRDGNIKDGVVGELWRLQCVTQMRKLAESETGIQDDVAFRVQRIGINHRRHELVGWKRLSAIRQFVRTPVDGKFCRNFGEEAIAFGIAPQNQIV